MKKHTIDWTQKDIDEFIIHHEIASSSVEPKKLIVVVQGSKVTYRVVVRQNVICDTVAFEEAVNEYNNA